MKEALPSDPAVAYEGGAPLLGCNNIWCSICNVLVRHVDDRRVPYPAGSPDECSALYDAPDPAQFARLIGGLLAAGFRTYFCRCSWADSGNAKIIAYADVPWGCTGHPPTP